MPVGLVLLESTTATTVMRWAARFAVARRTGLVVLQFKRRPRESGVSLGADQLPAELELAVGEIIASGFRMFVAEPVQADDASQGIQDGGQGDGGQGDERVKAGVEGHGDSGVEDPIAYPLQLVQLDVEQDVLAQIQGQIRTLGVELLVLPRDPEVKSSSPEFADYHSILSEVCCEVVQLISGAADGTRCGSILVPVSDGAHSHLAVRYAVELADATGAEVLPIFVEPEVDEFAQQVGEQILDRNLKKSLGGKAADLPRRVVLAASVEAGIQSAIDERTDLVVMGKQYHGVVHRFLFGSVSETIAQKNPGPAIAIFQPAMPLSSRIVRAMDNMARANVPQLQRDRRINLVERIQASSRWDFDFIALISLSTLIAGGGLIQNSLAVVIGAMLVAPLMTPLLGTGMSLVQGNLVMFRSTIATVLRGFLLAFGLGCLLGLLVPNCSVTSEMIARGSPGVLDLVVALISGIAAAYAIGRPNLLSALPGVAIAASLIPPVATAGICAVLGETRIAWGAAVLFVSNIVAIILGTACSFWAVGVRGSHSHSSFNRWATLAGVLLLVLTLGLGVYESWPAQRISPELQGRLERLLANQQSHCEKVHWARFSGGDRGVEVLLSSPRPLPPNTISRVRDLVREDLELRPDGLVRIRTQLETTFRGTPPSH